MEPVTHVLTGACLARSGLNRWAAYATAAMAIAAELPDIDTVWSLRGPIEGFQHHRGITHTLVGIPFEGVLLLLVFVLYHRFRSHTLVDAPLPSASRGSFDGQHDRQRTAPLRWGVLYGLILLALLSHLFLDFTNNYGIRPFFPFQRSWYAGSFVFIFDPLLFLLLLAGLLLPSLFALIGREVGAPRETFQGRGWARAALSCVLVLWSVRWFEHGKAVAAAQAQTLRAPAANLGITSPGETDASTNASVSNPTPEDRPLLLPGRSLASPDPLSIFRWYTATDFGPAYRLAVVDSRRETLSEGDVLVKPQASPILDAARRSHLGQVYLDWSSMPLLRIQNGSDSAAPRSLAAFRGFGLGAETITFTDLRFLGDVPLLRRGGHAPLSGEVVLDTSGHVVAEGLDGRYEP